MNYEDLINSTVEHPETKKESVEFIVSEVLFTIFCVIGMCADAAIIYTVFHFERMHSVPNIFLANWAVADLCSLIVTPSSYRIISVLENINLSQEFICFLFHTDLIFHSTAILFMTVIVVDWCLGAYFPNLAESIRNYYKFVIGLLWVVAIFLCSVSTRLCVKRVYHFIPGFLLLASYCLLLLFIITLHTVRIVCKYLKKNSEYPTLMLTLATVFVLSWLIGLINFIYFEIGEPGYHWMVTMISQCVVFASALINFVLLFRYNADFQKCVREALKRSNNRYEDIAADEDRICSAASQNSSTKEATSKV